MTNNTILLIFEITSANQLVQQCTKKGVLKDVLSGGVFNFLTILKFNRFSSFDV